MQLLLRDPAYTERLAAFLTSVGRNALARHDRVEVDDGCDDTDTGRLELDLYLRVWRVLYPDADVELIG